jgi:hypothetical protein
MAQKSLGIVSNYEFEILIGGLLIVLLWVSTWGLIEEGVEYLEDTYDVKKVYTYFALFTLVLLMIYKFPALLDRV